MTRAILLRTARIVLMVLLASLAVKGLAQEGVTPLPPSACAGLQGLSIPASAIGLATGGAVVQTSAPVAADS